jgi:Protein of unknown function DUF86
MPGQPWNDIRGMRNRLRHGYDRINVDIVWDTIRLRPLGDRANCALSFDDLVGNLKDAFGNREAERFGGLEVDDQRIFRRILNRKIARIGAP